MTRAGIGKKKFGVVGEGEDAKTVRINGPIMLPDLQHVTSGPRLRRLLDGIKKVVPAASFPAQAREMAHAMGVKEAPTSGKMFRRVLRRNRRRLSAIDLALALDGKRPMGSPVKEMRRKQSQAVRIAKMARMTVALLIRSSWGYHGKAPAMMAPVAAKPKGMDVYHAKIATIGTSIFTPAHPRFDKEGVFTPPQAELDRIAAIIAEDRAAHAQGETNG